VFAEWNEGVLDSYLIEITRDISAGKETGTASLLIDQYLVRLGAEGATVNGPA